MLLVLTAQPESLGEAMDELRGAVKGARIVKTLDEGEILAETDENFAETAGAIAKAGPVFARHICPADVVVRLGGTKGDVGAVAGAMRPVMSALDAGRTFSVQTRILGKNERAYKPFDINQAVSALSRAPLDVRKPEQVVSVVIAGDTAYAGVSTAEQNLSGWAGGKRRFAQEVGMVSRAEFKLLEALEVFGIELPRDGAALDLGAAPGGWTRVLAQRGLRVVAVDPGALDGSVARDARVAHERCLAQTYFARKTDRLFDVIVNDMKIDAQESADITVSAGGRLKPGGVGIMTLKLAKKGSARQAREGIKRLERGYSVVGARQLFHNRSEITVVFAPKH